MDNIFISPIHFAFSFTFPAEHIMPCIMELYVSGATFAQDWKLQAEAGLCCSAIYDTTVSSFQRVCDLV